MAESPKELKVIKELNPEEDQPLLGTCPKCKNGFELIGLPNNPSGYLCPICKSKGNLVIGVIHFKPRKPTLRAAAEALLEYIGGDGHTSIDSSNRFEVLVDALKEALE